MKVSFGVMQLSLLRPVRTVTRQVWTGACQKDLQKMVWSGLGHWREAGVDHRRTWTRNGPIAKDLSFNQNAVLPRTLPECGELVLNTSDPIKKAQLTHQIYSNLKCLCLFVFYIFCLFLGMERLRCMEKELHQIGGRGLRGLSLCHLMKCQR